MTTQQAPSIGLEWNDGYNFTASDAFGHKLTVDAPVQPEDEFGGFKPTHLLLTSLGACSGIDVVSILKKKRQDVTAFAVKVSGEQEPDWPKAWTSFHLEYTVTGHNIDPKAVERAIELSEGKYCSVSATVGGVATITRSYNIVEG